MTRPHSSTYRSYAPISRRADVLPFPDPPEERDIEKNNLLPFMFWPFYWFDKIMSAWRSVTPVDADLEKPDLGPAVPKSHDKETESEYIYKVELPGVERNRISLSVEKASVMLRLQEQPRARRRPHAIRRALSIPVYTNARAIRAKLTEGMLTITIPKTKKPVPPRPGAIAIE